MRHISKRPAVAVVLAFLFLVLASAMLAALLAGAVPIAPADVVAALLGGGPEPAATIIRELRLPRVLAAAVVGAALAVAGVLLQGLMRNPLADPFVTGTSAGATLFAVVGIVFGVGPLLLPLLAFLGALVAIATVWRLAHVGGGASVITVLLAGVALTSFAGALVTLLLVANDRLAQRLGTVLGWIQGGVAVTAIGQLVVAAAVIGVGLGLAIVIAPRLDAYAFGEETAATLGIDLERTTRIVLFTSAALCGAAVALAGLVGFVGLVVPHALRALVGPAHRRLILVSIPAGAAVLVLADLGARTAVAPTELPAGVFTGLLGAPFFLMLLSRVRRAAV